MRASSRRNKPYKTEDW